jgi:hypothetical protein
MRKTILHRNTTSDRDVHGGAGRTIECWLRIHILSSPDASQLRSSSRRRSGSVYGKRVLIHVTA